MPTPQHETEREREALRRTGRMFKHPSEIPSILRASWASNREYFSGRDLTEVDREELIRIIVYMRKLAMKMIGGAWFLFIWVMVLAFTRNC